MTRELKGIEEVWKKGEKKGFALIFVEIALESWLHIRLL